MTIERLSTDHGEVRYKILEGRVTAINWREPDHTQFSLEGLPLQLVYMGNPLKISEGDEVRAAIPLYDARRSMKPFSRKIIITPRKSDELREQEEVTALYVKQTNGKRTVFQADYNPGKALERTLPTACVLQLVLNDTLRIKY